MKVKIKDLPEDYPFWMNINDSYSAIDAHGGYFVQSPKYGNADFFITDSFVEVIGEHREPVDHKESSNDVSRVVTESQLKAFRKAAILAKEYCEEVKLNHESKMGNASWRRSDEVLYQGLRQDLEFLDGVVECFEDIWPEEYI